MNPYADPAFVTAEVAYRFERDRITHPVARPRRPGVARWVHRLTRHGSSTGRRHVRIRRA